MEEIIQAFRVSFDVPIHREVISNPNNAEFLNMADASVRRLVKMGKNLSTFRSISQEDQVALLKGSVLEVLILRSIKMFDRRTMNWHVKRSGTEHTVSATGLQANKDSMAFLEQYQKFATGVMMSIQGDMALLMLLMVLSVFSPDRPNVKNKAVVSEAQEGYARLLQEYVNVRFPTADSSLFGKILQKLADIRDLDETHAKMLLHMNVDQLEPLIVEIFDLSSWIVCFLLPLPPSPTQASGPEIQVLKCCCCCYQHTFAVFEIHFWLSLPLPFAFLKMVWTMYMK